jgi:hypothetical protein
MPEGDPHNVIPVDFGSPHLPHVDADTADSRRSSVIPSDVEIWRVGIAGIEQPAIGLEGLKKVCEEWRTDGGLVRRFSLSVASAFTDREHPLRTNGLVYVDPVRSLAERAKNSRGLFPCMLSEEEIVYAAIDTMHLGSEADARRLKALGRQFERALEDNRSV